jgi:trafficking protein particle complex subunit 12
MASKHFAIVDEDPAADQGMKDMNAALLASAEGDWTRASTVLRTVLEEDAENVVVSV